MSSGRELVTDMYLFSIRSYYLTTTLMSREEQGLAHENTGDRQAFPEQPLSALD